MSGVSFIGGTVIVGPPLSPREAAARLGVSPVTVRRWVNSGELPAVRLGDGPLSRIRIPQQALAAFVRPVDEDG